MIIQRGSKGINVKTTRIIVKRAITTMEMTGTSAGKMCAGKLVTCAKVIYILSHIMCITFYVKIQY